MIGTAAFKKTEAANKPKTVTILGSTGSIGKNTVALLENSPEFKVEALTSNCNAALLAEQAKKLGSKLAVIAEEKFYPELAALLAGTGIEAAAGHEKVKQAAGMGSDIVISAIVGAAALEPTLAAIAKGSAIGLANKECLVCAGQILIDKALKNASNIIPIDSEHNTLFQIFDFANEKSVEKITLTASGGPFLNRSRSELKDITPEQAVKHPNWSMGAKISIDSATMMNKGLELIEAYYLFPVEKGQIDILVHPESIVHGLVSYIDGSVSAGLSIPDMRVPISYALSWPKRMKAPTKRLDLASIGTLNFFSPDENKFPALKLAREVLQSEGTAPTILNSSNEIAVENFLSGKISFLKITEIVDCCLNKLGHSDIKGLEDVLEADRKARQVANELIAKGC